MTQKATLGKEETENEPVCHTQPTVKTQGRMLPEGPCRAGPGTPGAPTGPRFSPLCQVPGRHRCLVLPGTPPPHASALGKRPSMQRGTWRGSKPQEAGLSTWQKDDSPPCCLELRAGDSPACAWPLFSPAGSAVQPTGAPANRDAPANCTRRSFCLWLTHAPDSGHPVSFRLLLAGVLPNGSSSSALNPHLRSAPPPHKLQLFATGWALALA